ncbi:MAG: hypothetical protein HOO92_04750 [Methylococcaceae bacterium]|nr:hypothetical protein [Methylococcaceae bacterium]
MNNKELFSTSNLSWFVFLVVVLTYGYIYAPYGIENNDGGFILGLSYQVFLGNSFYNNIIYVRPPVSPILHSFVFHYPFSLAPVYFDRLFFYFQISTYSALSAMLAKRMFKWESAFTGVVASIIFIFSAHSFPPMAWHTIDGIFFSVLALYFLVAGLKDHSVFLILSACFAILAAGSKQPFYLMPILLLALSFILGYKKRAFLIMLASLFCASVLFILTFECFGSAESMWGAISSQTSLYDLYTAGVKNYVSDIKQGRSVIAAWPLFIVLFFCKSWKEKNKAFEAIGLLAVIWVFLLIIAQFYFSARNWAQPSSIFDSVFIITFVYSSTMMLKKRHDAWLVIVAMHIIGWTSSISWGYLTAIFYAAPSVITLAFILHPACQKYLAAKIISIAILPASVLTFYVGNQFTYSLEGAVHRTSITADMAGISPLLRFIKAEPEKFKLYSELMNLLNRFGKHPYVVMPNMPLAHILTSSANPIGIDWLLNAEVGGNEQIIKDRLASSVDFAIVYNKANPKPELPEKFGSKATVYVIQNWKLKESSENFSIYVNPVRVRELINL